MMLYRDGLCNSPSVVNGEKRYSGENLLSGGWSGESDVIKYLRAWDLMDDKFQDNNHLLP
jgi:hypothetical protein